MKMKVWAMSACLRRCIRCPSAYICGYCQTDLVYQTIHIIIVILFDLQICFCRHSRQAGTLNHLPRYELLYSKFLVT
jgi:hypothetical protein